MIVIDTIKGPMGKTPFCQTYSTLFDLTEFRTFLSPTIEVIRWQNEDDRTAPSIYSAFYAAIKTVEQDLEKARQQRLNKLLDRKIALVKEQIQENDRPTKLT